MPSDVVSIATQFGLGVVAVFIVVRFTVSILDRERTAILKDRDEWKAEAKAERTERDKTDERVMTAIATLDRMSQELPKQREQQNEIYRLATENGQAIRDVRDRVGRLEGPR